MIKNIIFDFDGVILDSVPTKTEAYAKLFQEFPSAKVEKLIEYHMQNGGISRYVKIKHFFEKILFQSVAENEILEYANRYSQLTINELLNDKYVIQEVLAFIKTHHYDCNLHIASGADENDLKLICDRLDLARYFKSVHGSPKPKSLLVKEIIELNDYDKTKTILIGDSVNDHAAAKENGIEFFGYNNAELKCASKFYIENFDAFKRKFFSSRFKKITVVTVTFNAQRSLEQTINSVLEQKHENIEYVIVDGNSSDNTVDIIKKYEQDVDYWISEPDNGIYDAMNKAIDVATGEWIIFMNAGDGFCNAYTVSDVIGELSEEIDILAGSINYVTATKSEFKKPYGADFRYDGMFCWHQAMFTKASLLKKYKFDSSFKLAGDYDFALKCYENGFKFKFIDLAVANFIEGGFAQSNPILGRIEDMFIQSKYLKDISTIFAKHSFSSLEAYKTSNNRTLARLLNVLSLQTDKLKLKEKKFILYGYGNLGKIIYSFYKENVLFVIDQDYKELRNLYPDIDFFPQDVLKERTNQYLLITVLGREGDIQKAILEKYDYDNSKFLEFEL